VTYLLPLQPALLAGATGFLTALLAVALLAVIGRRRSGPLPSRGRLQFEGRALVASDGSARSAFDDTEPAGDDWTRAVALLGPDFPELDAARPPGALPEGLLRSRATGEVLAIHHQDGVVTLSLDGPGAADIGQEATSARVSATELEALRDVTNHLPYPVWVHGPDGNLEWTNATYLTATADVGPATDAEGDTWSPPPLFDPALLPAATPEGASARVRIGPPDAPRHWFEVHARDVRGRALYAAANVDATVRAERNLREFTQTLTKTFAHLTIGLAIFDQKRRLILFNPALTDMTGLEPEILAGRPTLVGFLDRLRERRIIPEPKDYASWRRKMAELEAAAVDGSYGETWSLPTGQTYRVTGRPHPDGAVIFLFEDISAEISLTRRFRAELEMGQAVIDSLEEAVAVFTVGGMLAMTNAAYADLWGHDPDAELSAMSVAETTSVWLSRSAPTPAWGDFRDFARQGHSRGEWSADVILRDGRALCCRFVPLSEGGTLAAFRLLRADDIRAGEPRRQSA
jgi:PAS domain-containing protein